MDVAHYPAAPTCKIIEKDCVITAAWSSTSDVEKYSVYYNGHLAVENTTETSLTI